MARLPERLTSASRASSSARWFVCFAGVDRVWVMLSMHVSALAFKHAYIPSVFLCGGDPAMIVEPLRDEVEFSIKPATTDKA